jgi:hypothetical protein
MELSQFPSQIFTYLRFALVLPQIEEPQARRFSGAPRLRLRVKRVTERWLVAVSKGRGLARQKPS